MKSGPTLRQLLLGVNIFILLVPTCAVLFLPVLDAYLIRQTERRLIGESVVIAEAWRSALLQELGVPPAEEPSFRPPDSEEEHFVPLVAQTDLLYQVLPSHEPASRFATARDGPDWRAGASIAPLLERAQVFNLSGVRVFNQDACVVATTRGDLGGCFEGLTEVIGALAGEYTAVIRRRASNERPPPLASISRRGSARVFTGTPVFMGEDVVGVVRMSRTAVSPLEALWTHRGKVALVLTLCLVITPLVTYSLSHAISRPVRALTARADAIARSEDPSPFVPGRAAPREMRVLSSALDRMTDQLTERADYISEFASNVSHELKTPLTGITGAVELLREEWDGMESQQRQRFLDNIASDAERMERLVARLLELARIQATPDEASRVDVGAFMKTLVGRYGAPVRLTLAENLPPLSINPEHLEMAVRNLVDNALRHGAGSPVEISVSRVDDRTAIDVRDHGPGIRPANRTRIFERFFTTERDTGGTGLGLPIVQAVARTRGGDVLVDTGADGTCFRLLL